MTTTRKPTAEQQNIIDAAVAGGNLVIQAGAGTGKTSTLELIANALPTKKILYIVYNKSMQVDASGRMPAHVTTKTGHSLAFGAVGRKYAKRLGGRRMPGKQIASILGAPSIVFDEDTRLTPVQVARIARETVTRYCYSADIVIGQEHVPFQNGIRGAAHAKLKTTVLPLARKYWEDVKDVNGVLPFTHDYYLKLWALSKPKLNADVILLDEAQDTNPVLADLVQSQTHAQQIVVGDGCQQMYAWRGAVDALPPEAEETPEDDLTDDEGVDDAEVLEQILALPAAEEGHR